MAVKHTLAQAWTTFKLEYEIRENLLSILSLTPDDLIKLQLRINEKIFSFDAAYGEWKTGLISSNEIPESPSHAIDSFALVWDEKILFFLRNGGHLLTYEVEKYLKKRLEALFNDYEIQKIVNNVEERRDAFSYAFAKCVVKWKDAGFVLTRGLVAYFKEAFSNACMDVARAAAKNIHFKALDTLSAEAQKSVDVAIEAIEKHTIHVAMDAFALKNKECFDLIKMSADGYSALEMGNSFDISEASARKRLNRCIDRFKAFFKKYNTIGPNEQ